MNARWALPVSPRDAHTAEDPCLVCGGHSDVPSDDDRHCGGVSKVWRVFCTRADLAGNLPPARLGERTAYKHRRHGECDCGAAHQSA
jgi:hypothetical protein